ncbi:phosphoenolpyruvate carboxylase [Pseudomonas aeruginosa]|nr:phosphoenolpyruvate carboxylase [Pseudomonas aeruginosa]
MRARARTSTNWANCSATPSAEQYGPLFLDKIELIRKGAKATRRGSAEERPAAHRHPRRARGRRTTAGGAGLQPVLEDAWPISPSNTTVSTGAGRTSRNPSRTWCWKSCWGVSRTPDCPEQLARQLAGLEIELVLTAHPTEVARRTLIRNTMRSPRSWRPRTMPTCCRRSAVASSSACSGWWPRPDIPTRSARSGRPRWTRRK